MEHHPENDQEPHIRWSELPFDVRQELEGIGMNAAVFEMRMDDPTFQDGLDAMDAYEDHELRSMSPNERRRYWRDYRRQLAKDLADSDREGQVEKQIEEVFGNRGL